MIRLIVDVINTDLPYPMKLLSHTMLKFVYRIRYRNPPFFTQCGIRTQDLMQIQCNQVANGWSCKTFLPIFKKCYKNSLSKWSEFFQPFDLSYHPLKDFRFVRLITNSVARC